MLVLFYLISLVFIYWFAAEYSKWQFIDEDDGPGWNKSDTKWHRAGLIMRMCIALAMLGWIFPANVSFEHLVLLMPILAIEWDILLNLGRGKKWNYVGGGGWDAKIGQRKWCLYGIWLLGSIIFCLLWRYFV